MKILGDKLRVSTIVLATGFGLIIFWGFFRYLDSIDRVRGKELEEYKASLMSPTAEVEEPDWPMRPYFYIGYPAEDIQKIWGEPYEIHYNDRGVHYNNVDYLEYYDRVRRIYFKFETIESQIEAGTRRWYSAYCQDIEIEGPRISRLNPWRGSKIKPKSFYDNFNENYKPLEFEEEEEE